MKSFHASTPERALSALLVCDPSCKRLDWFRLGCAAKAEGVSFEDFNDWSAQAPNYGGRADALTMWNSIKDDGGVAAGTLFASAQATGRWSDDGPEQIIVPREKTRREPEPRPAPKWPAAVALAECVPATSDHPYIARKGGMPDGLRVYPDSAPPQRIKGRDVRGCLAVPACDEAGNLMTVQFIAPDGEKLNLQGESFGETARFLLGDLAPGAPVYVCEGIGAAWAARQATGDAACVAFGVHRQQKIAKAMMQAGALPIIVSDRGKESDCERAAAEVGCAWVALPADLAEGRDLDDLKQSGSLEAVAAVLRDVRAPVAPGRDDARRRKQQDENAKIQDAGRDTAPPALSVDEMLVDCVWIASGSQVGRISDPRTVLAFNEFCDLTAASASFKQSEDGRRKRIPNALEWKQSDARQTVYTRTFHAGESAICKDPDGVLALNSWRPITRWEAGSDVAPFLDQVAYLVPDDSERAAFLDWLAHIEQFPGVLPHYGWLHIAKNTGTGRNWLASVLARVWRGYVAPNVDLPALLESQFNGALAGRVLAMVDEVQEGGGENQFRHANRLKSLVNAEYRDINPKFGRQYREHNSCRWLVNSNHANALPLNDTDRRWWVLRHDAAPRPAGDYARLYALLEDREFINAVGVWLHSRDITEFNPGARPPMSDAKRAAIGASKSLMQQHAQEIAEHWPADVITNADAAAILSGIPESPLTPAMRRALEEIGATNFPRTLKVNRQVTRCWVLRDHAQWMHAASAEIVAEAKRATGDTFGTRSAIEVLAGLA